MALQLTRLTAWPVLLLVLVGCTITTPVVEEGAAPAETAPSPQRVAPAASEEACPVTYANGNAPPGYPSYSPGFHGNGAIWTPLWPRGKILITPPYVEPDGSLRMKFPWWWKEPAPLAIQGRRLDAAAPPLRAEVAASYDDGPVQFQFQPSMLFFPSEGCWEVTGKAGDASLPFVVLIERSNQPVDSVWRNI